MVFTVQHILILKLFMIYSFPGFQSIHDFLFLVETESEQRFELGFYDFYRAGLKTYSPTVDLLLKELQDQNFIERKRPAITEDGREVYYALSSALEPFASYTKLCLHIGERYIKGMDQIKHALRHNLTFRRAKSGQVIFKKGGA